jgi:hypothetical protein
VQPDSPKAALPLPIRISGAVGKAIYTTESRAKMREGMQEKKRQTVEKVT